MLIHVNPGAVNCQDVERFLYDYAERELDQRLLLAFDSHLLGCARCNRVVASYIQSRDLVRRHLPAELKMPADVRSSVLREMSRHSA